MMPLDVAEIRLGRNEHKKGPKAAPTASSSEASFQHELHAVQATLS